MINKNIILLLAICAFAASCANQEDSDIIKDGKVELTFNTYIDKGSRALEKNTFGKGDEFCVNAFSTDGSTIGLPFESNFLDNETLVKSSDGWALSTVKYWPMRKSERVSFVAVYPNVAPVKTDNSFLCTFNVDDNPTQQTEFLWSTVTDAYAIDQNGTFQNGIEENPNLMKQGGVGLTFKHGLSKVAFLFKTDHFYNGLNIVVTDISVKNVYHSGTYNIPFSLEDGKWKTIGNTTNYDVLKNGSATVPNDNYAQIGSSLLMIPQHLKAEAEVTMRYKITSSSDPAGREYERTFKLADSDGGSWEMGKAYNYHIKISLNVISFEPTIAEWDNDDNTIFLP